MTPAHNPICLSRVAEEKVVFVNLLIWYAFVLGDSDLPLNYVFYNLS